MMINSRGLDFFSSGRPAMFVPRNWEGHSIEQSIFFDGYFEVFSFGGIIFATGHFGS